MYIYRVCTEVTVTQLLLARESGCVGTECTVITM